MYRHLIFNLACLDGIEARGSGVWWPQRWPPKKLASSIIHNVIFLDGSEVNRIWSGNCKFEGVAFSSFITFHISNYRLVVVYLSTHRCTQKTILKYRFASCSSKYLADLSGQAVLPCLLSFKLCKSENNKSWIFFIWNYIFNASLIPLKWYEYSLGK